MKTVIFGIFIFLAVNISLSATAQLPNGLIYKDSTYLLYTNPLEKFFDEHPELKPEAEILSSNLWRGYLATFEIIDGKLRLRDIRVNRYQDATQKISGYVSVIDEVFPNDEERYLDWFSGFLIVPMGDLVQYVHQGYVSKYERYKLIQISGGEFIEERDYTKKEFDSFKIKQFEAFEKTEAYQRKIEELLPYFESKERAKISIKRSILYYTEEFFVAEEE